MKILDLFNFMNQYPVFITSDNTQVKNLGLKHQKPRHLFRMVDKETGSQSHLK